METNKDNFQVKRSRSNYSRRKPAGSKEQYRKIRGRVLKLQVYYNHIVWYVLVNGAMVGFNFYYTPDKLWFYYPLAGWGMGVLFHTLRVYNIQIFFGRKWVSKTIKNRMEKINTGNM